MSEKSRKHELKGKAKFLAALSSFLEKNKVILLVILAVVAAALIIITVVDTVSSNKANNAAAMAEDVETVYEQWLSTADDDSLKADLESGMLEDLDDIIADYPKTYAAQRAYFIKANISFQNEDWSSAAGSFSDAASVNRESYLAPVSLALAASSYENSDEFQKALDIYMEIDENYRDSYPDGPRVMLSIARLYEQIGDKTAAVDAYNSMIDTFPSSGWTSFARTRLIQIGE